MTNEINIYRGDDKTITLTITDEEGDAINVSNYVIFFTVKETDADGDNDAIMKIDQTIVDGSTGIVTIDITNTHTADLLEKTYVYDIQWKDTNNDIKTLVKGDFIVSYDVTTRTTASS